MTLARRMTLKTAGLMLGLAVLLGAGWWGVAGLGRDLDAALDEYRRLRLAQEAGRRAVIARAMLESDRPSPARMTAEAIGLATALDALARDLQTQPARQSPVRSLADRAEELVRGGASDPAPLNAAALGRLAEETLDQMARLTRQFTVSVRATQAQADARRGWTLAILAAVGSITLLAAVLIAVSQHRGVMAPIRRLRGGVRRAADGQLAERLPVEGDDEFRALAADFNHMNARLEALYLGLEQQVRQKSEQLVRADRLASIGYLAAGVAHEINNPLHIISGHAELALRRIDAAIDDHAIASACRALEIARDEALRCKAITDKLLALARDPDGAADARTPVRRRLPAAALLRQVADSVRGLSASGPEPRVRLILPDPADPLPVLADEGELKQVLLNLVVNGLQALGDRPGAQVRLIGRRTGEGAVTIVVEDDGRGMTPEVRERVFEPFFSHGPSGQTRGTGLGLSISHAIVQSLGGTLDAASDGPDRGSRFTLTLPTPTGNGDAP